MNGDSGEVTIWTPSYEPFSLGGAWQPIKTKAIPEQIVKIAGYAFYVIKHPTHGHYHIAECETGALVQVGKTDADALGNIARDCSRMDRAVLEMQLAEARKAVLQARYTEPNDFWRKLKAL